MIVAYNRMAANTVCVGNFRHKLEIETAPERFLYVVDVREITPILVEAKER